MRRRADVDAGGDARAPAGVDVAGCPPRPREDQIAVVRESVAEGRAEDGKGLVAISTAQQELVGPERSGGHDDDRGLDRTRLDALRRIGVSLREAHKIAAVWQRLDRLGGVERAHLRPVALGDRKVRHVHRVLRVGRAAERAVAREIARQLPHTSVRVGARSSGVHRDRYQLRLAPEATARVEEGNRARRQHATIGRTQRLRVEHLARQLVVRLEQPEVDRSWHRSFSKMLAGGWMWTLK